MFAEPVAAADAAMTVAAAEVQVETGTVLTAWVPLDLSKASPFEAVAVLLAELLLVELLLLPPLPL